VVQTNDKKLSLTDLIADLLARPGLSLVVAQQPCVLAAPKVRVYDKAILIFSFEEPDRAIEVLTDDDFWWSTERN
jgi:hypothetical protein